MAQPHTGRSETLNRGSHRVALGYNFSVNQRRANIFGLGLIGGSLAAALTARGWHVTGNDVRPETEEEAFSLGLISAQGIDADAEVSFVATPVSSVSAQVKRALETTTG